MTQRVQAMFVCNNVPEDDDEYGSVEMNCVYDAPEWKAFTDATPYGELSMCLSPGTSAHKFFELGVEYRVTFERVEES